MLRALLFITGSVSISLITSMIAYWRVTRAIVKVEYLYLTGEQFMIGAAVAGLILSFF